MSGERMLKTFRNGDSTAVKDVPEVALDGISPGNRRS